MKGRQPGSGYKEGGNEVQVMKGRQPGSGYKREATRSRV
jgi:hypothetical protein